MFYYKIRTTTEDNKYTCTCTVEPPNKGHIETSHIFHCTIHVEK